jgi:hypothetical protein
MSNKPNLNPNQTNLWLIWLSLLTSSSTLICCALPALLVTLGLGAVLAGWVSAVPALVVVSEYKASVFGVAIVLLALASALHWRARNAPCPIESKQACQRLRRINGWVLAVSIGLYVLGFLFAFGLPWWFD